MSEWRLASDLPPRDQEVMLYVAGGFEKGYHDGRNWRIVNNGDYHFGGYGNDYTTDEKPGEYGYPHPTHWAALSKP